MSFMRLDPPLDGDHDHIRGPIDAPMELVMYGDFQCPFCVAAQRIVARVRDRLGDDLRFGFRHFPLRDVHPDAEAAAEASEAAAAQGAFWPMHDRLYDAGGNRLAVPDLVGYARQLGLDDARVAAELADGTRAPRVRRDVDSGLGSGVTGTPGFFANGVRLDGAFDAGSMVRALRETSR
jgi:NhaA family Na+:H+ antiporter